MFGRFRSRPGAAQSEAGKDYYDRAFAQAEHWQAHYTKSSYYFIWTVILDRLRRLRPKAILEIGCGPGQLAAAIHEAGLAPRYTGLDFSATALGFARRACPAHFEFREEDAVASNVYESLDYDVVISTEFLEHVEKDLEVLGKLRTGTRVIATVPNFPYVSHVRHFGDAAGVESRYCPLFRDFSVAPIRGVQDGTCFYLMEGTKL